MLPLYDDFITDFSAGISKLLCFSLLAIPLLHCFFHTTYSIQMKNSVRIVSAMNPVAMENTIEKFS